MQNKLSLNAPITHGSLVALLGYYKRPNDKISYMIAAGVLTRIKKGLYLFNKPLKAGSISLFQVANVLNGPSYVSMYSALAYYGLIPERVATIESVTTKRTKTYQTPVGFFKYFAGKDDTFHLGIDYKKLNDTAAFLIATPTKAICDILWHTKKIQIASIDELQFFLEKDMRFDMDRMKELDVQLAEACSHTKRNQKTLQLLKDLILLNK